MRKIVFLTLGTLAAAAGMAAPVQAAPRLTGEAELARTVEGRVAGKPVDCIQLSDVRSSRIIDHTAIVYEAGSVLYVNRPRGGAESLDQWDTLVTRTQIPELCSVDVVQLYDSAAHMQHGAVFLGAFVPYRRVPRAAPAHD